MPKFTFRLSALLSLRGTERDACRAELAAALASQRQAAEGRETGAEELRRHLEETRARTTPGLVDLGKLRSAGAYEAALRGQLASLAGRERAATAEVERCQEVLAAAEGEVRVLEKLREGQHDRFRDEQSRHETRQLDELTARQHREAPVSR